MEIDIPSLNNIQKYVWRGELPLQIVLAPSESRVYDQADPYFVRHSFLLFPSLVAPSNSPILLGALEVGFGV